MSSSPSPAHTNALVHETSPYLRQHAHNPVDWKPWGPAALEEARRDNKLIFLSIGYAACHWCHVMEHESFENEDVAALLNREFVSIKVDREERPDIDEIYMTATLVFTGGHGGWPMSVFLAPDLKPVYAGTYFPPQDAYGRPGFMTLLRFLADRWSNAPETLLGDSDKVLSVVQRLHAGDKPAERDLSPEEIRAAADQVYRAFDKQRGGIPSGNNKFPSTLAVDLMLRVWRRTGEKRFLEIAELTLEKLGNGGIYDHLGGGVHRYATDVRWLVPHFEKMLYDQALVAGVAVDLWQATGREDLKRLVEHRARGICDYVLHDLASPDGGFYSSEDADSEGLEGKFYIWTREEVFALAGDDLSAKLFCSHYDVTETGNWMHPGDAHVPAGPKAVLQVVRDVETIAKLESLEVADVERRIADVSAKLLAARNERVRPGLDDKILSGWNGLMITALAKTAAVFDEPHYAEAASRAADFIWREMVVDGRLRATYGGGQAKLTAYASDYAFLVEGLVALYQATGDAARLDQAERLTETLVAHYWDEVGGGFFFTADDHEELLVRSKTCQDGATPSANSVMAGNLLRLASLLDRRDLAERAERTFRAFADGARSQPFQAERLLAEAEALTEGPTEVVIVGPAGNDRTRELERAVFESYLPAKVVARFDPAGPRPAGALFAGRELVDGRPAAYVCRGFVCERPTVEPDALRAQLLSNV